MSSTYAITIKCTHITKKKRDDPCIEMHMRSRVCFFFSLVCLKFSGSNVTTNLLFIYSFHNNSFSKRSLPLSPIQPIPFHSSDWVCTTKGTTEQNSTSTNIYCCIFLFPTFLFYLLLFVLLFFSSFIWFVSFVTLQSSEEVSLCERIEERCKYAILNKCSHKYNEKKNCVRLKHKIHKTKSRKKNNTNKSNN